MTPVWHTEAGWGPSTPSALGASCRQPCADLPEAASGGRDQVPQRGHAPDVGRAPAGERDRLVAVAGRAQDVADRVEGPADVFP
jgi:hypothetical protein